MEELRHDIRVDCEEKCVMHLGGLHYFATFRNISSSGAVVHFNTSQPGLHIGDNCIISVDGGPIREYSCEVVRVENPDIVVRFIDTETITAVVQ